MKKLTALLLALSLLLLLLPAAAAAGDTKVAAFTFDDGPNRNITPTLLDALAERGVRATFFVNGQNAERYPEIVQRAAAEGHQIANHTYSHSRLTSLSAEKASYEISRTENYLSSLLGRDHFLVRVPYGAINSTVQSLIDVPIMMWSVDPTSGRVMSAAAMRDGIVNTAHDGAIILLHDMNQANLDAAIQSIDILLDRGYTFVTLDELFEIKGVTPQGGTVYHKLTGDNTAPYFDGKDLSTHWAWEDISYVEETGVMVGDGNRFRPDWGMTRAEAIMVLYRMAGLPQGYPAAPFEDVKSGDWFADAVAWAAAEGVTMGVSETRFGPTSYVTKEQFYTLFARYVLADTPLPAEAAAIAVAGDETVSAWASDALRLLRAFGFRSAAHEPRFYPQSGITRAETAELLAWFLRMDIAPSPDEEPDGPDAPQNDPVPDDVIAAALRDIFRSEDPDGLVRLQSYRLLAQETTNEIPREETVYLIVCHATYWVSGEPAEIEGGIVPMAITFSVDGNGIYSLKDYWTPDAGADQEQEVRSVFPAAAAEAALNAEAYAEQLETDNWTRLDEYLDQLSRND